MKFILLSASALILCACAEAPVARTHVKMDSILQQINSAISAADDTKDKSAPQITSVQLDLQLGVSSSVDASGPLGLFVLGANASQQDMHSVSLVFVPTVAVRAPSAVSDGALGELATAIRAIYHSVPSGGPNFKFQNGSVKIQCVFKTSLDGGVDSKLIPVEFDVATTGQRTQTVTLNFGSSESIAGGVKPQGPAATTTPDLTTIATPKLPATPDSSSSGTKLPAANVDADPAVKPK